MVTGVGAAAVGAIGVGGRVGSGVGVGSGDSVEEVIVLVDRVVGWLVVVDDVVELVLGAAVVEVVDEDEVEVVLDVVDEDVGLLDDDVVEVGILVVELVEEGLVDDGVIEDEELVVEVLEVEDAWDVDELLLECVVLVLAAAEE